MKQGPSHNTRPAKEDSSSVAAKVRLRRWLLDRMGIEEAYVLDACAGLGQIWESMEDHVSIMQWTKCDIEPRRAGTLKIDATDAISRFPVETYNVVDIDPYGDPWVPYWALLPRITKPTAVFLTHSFRLNVTQVSKSLVEAAGIPIEWFPDIPHDGALARYLSERMLSRTVDFVDVLHSARMSVERGPRGKGSGSGLKNQTVHYYALGLSPKAGPGGKG